MGTSSQRARDRRSFRLEFLEDRKLLSTFKHHGVAAEVRTGPLTQVPSIIGTLHGQSARQGLYGGTAPGNTSYSGTGTAKSVGYVYFGSQETQTINPTTKAMVVSNGSGLLTTYQGEKIYVNFSGSGTPAGRGKDAVSLQGTVMGGTGRFTDVTGTFSASGTIQQSGKGRLNLAFNIALTYPATA